MTSSKALVLSGVIGFAAVVWIGCSSDAEPAAITDTPEGGAAETGASDSSTGTDTGATKDTGVVDTGTKDAGKLTGPFVDIGYGAATCPAFTPCGGDPLGTWTVKSGCVKEEIFDVAREQCPTIEVSDVVFQGRGFVTATPTNIVRHTEVKFSAKFFVPSACKAIVGSCALISTALKTIGQLDAAACTDDVASGGCNCDVSDLQEELGDDIYSKSGSTITTGSGGTARTYAYCVESAASQITLQETTQAPQPAILVLQK